MRQRQWDPATAFEWFEFRGNPTADEQIAALIAIARSIDEEAANCSPPAWSGLVAPEQSPSDGGAGRWGSTTPSRQAPVPAWLKRPSPHQRP